MLHSVGLPVSQKLILGASLGALHLQQVAVQSALMTSRGEFHSIWFSVWHQLNQIYILGKFGVARRFQKRERRRSTDAALLCTSPRRAVRLPNPTFSFKLLVRGNR